MIFDLYSKRQKVERGEVAEIFTYDNIPKKLRVQIIQILSDAIGQNSYSYDTEVENAYKFIHQALCREYGVFSLTKTNSDEYAVRDYFLNTTNNDEALDIIELCFRYLVRVIAKDYQYLNKVNRKINPDDAVKELNERFKENEVGYVFESEKLIRIDSTFTHSELTKPALKLLSSSTFSNANEEFLKAHEHYLHGRNKECLAECLKAMESVMKIICTQKGWQFAQTDTSKKLLKICFDNHLIPAYLQTQFNSLQSVLESGVPTIRNKIGGHGQGSEKKEAEDYLTRYTLNLTSANLVYLIEQSGVV